MASTMCMSLQQNTFQRFFSRPFTSHSVHCRICCKILPFLCRGSSYSLLKHNCNSFSEDLCQFLCGTSIPKYILDLPQEFLSTPLGQTLGPLIGLNILLLTNHTVPTTITSIFRSYWCI